MIFLGSFFRLKSQVSFGILNKRIYCSQKAGLIPLKFANLFIIMLSFPHASVQYFQSLSVRILSFMMKSSALKLQLNLFSVRLLVLIFSIMPSNEVT